MVEKKAAVDRSTIRKKRRDAFSSGGVAAARDLHKWHCLSATYDKFVAELSRLPEEERQGRLAPSTVRAVLRSVRDSAVLPADPTVRNTLEPLCSRIAERAAAQDRSVLQLVHLLLDYGARFCRDTVVRSVMTCALKGGFLSGDVSWDVLSSILVCSWRYKRFREIALAILREDSVANGESAIPRSSLTSEMATFLELWPCGTAF